MDDIRFTMGVSTVSGAARLLDVQRQTLAGWAGTKDGSPPLLHVLEKTTDEAVATMPFIALAEAHVLNALRDAGVRPHKIRPALEHLRSEFGEYVLVAPELATDGVDALWDLARSEPGQGLVEGRTGQHVMREIVQDYLKYITWADDKFPESLRIMRFEPYNVVVDPHRFFGQPYFAGSGVRVADVVGMLRADEDPEVVADEFGLDLDTVRGTARISLGRAA
ncbi:DUF433 domain-containing protein [Streptomonospora sediminis]